MTAPSPPEAGRISRRMVPEASAVTASEINGGICHPIGSVSHGSQLAGLLNAAYNQVKQVYPNTTVRIHLAQSQKYDSLTTFFNAYHGNGGKWHKPTVIMNAFTQA